MNPTVLNSSEKPKRRSYYKPEEWDGTPSLTIRTPEEQKAYEKAHPLLYSPKKERQAPPDAPVDPAVLEIRRLAQQRYAQKTDQLQAASQREFARQEREDKAIAEFLAWNPPANIWRM